MSSKVQVFKDFIEKYNNSEPGERATWEEYFANLSLFVSTRSPSLRLKVGAVIVKDNRVISSGYNGFPSGCEHKSIVFDGHEQNTIHAEQNAISDAARRGAAVDGASMYVTHFPCINCCKYIISSGIKRVVYISDYRNTELVPDLFRQSGVDLKQIS
jgi:dCMP deaminase